MVSSSCKEAPDHPEPFGPGFPIKASMVRLRRRSPTLGRGKHNVWNENHTAEAQIDSIVYELFELMRDEIALLDAAS
jgi:hypothetical protein